MMGWQTIPDDQELAREIAEQILEKRTLVAVEGFLLDITYSSPAGVTALMTER